MKQENAVVLFADKKFLFALGTFIINLQKYIKYNCIIIYHSDFEEEDKKCLTNIEKNIQFIKYSLDDFCHEFGFDKEIITSLHSIKSYTHISPTKYKMLTLLDQFSRITFFDCDMILMDSINELYNNNYNIAWKTDEGATIQSKLNFFQYSTEKIKERGCFDIYSKAKTPNGGFLIINDNFDYQKAYEVGHKFFKENFLEHPFLMGEITLGYIAYIMKLNIYEINSSIYNTFPHLINIKSKLIHFFRNTKPWNNASIQYIYRDWVDNYNMYLKLTRKPSPEVKIFENIGQDYIVKQFFRNKWEHLFTQLNFSYPSELKPIIDITGNSVSFTYNEYITYDIYTPNIYFNDYRCRMLISDKHPNGKDFIISRIQELVRTSNNLNYIKFKNIIGCRTNPSQSKNIQNNFDYIYKITASLRALLSNTTLECQKHIFLDKLIDIYKEIATLKITYSVGRWNYIHHWSKQCERFLKFYYSLGDRQSEYVFMCLVRQAFASCITNDKEQYKLLCKEEQLPDKNTVSTALTGEERLRDYTYKNICGIDREDYIFNIMSPTNSITTQLSDIIGAKGKIFNFESALEDSTSEGSIKACKHKNIFTYKFSTTTERNKLISYTILDGNNTYTTLDDFVIKNNVPRINFIRLNTKYTETVILEGCKEICKKFSPVFIITINNNATDLTTIPQKILEIDNKYRFYIKYHQNNFPEATLFAVKGESAMQIKVNKDEVIKVASFFEGFLNTHRNKQLDIRKKILTSCNNILKKCNKIPTTASFDEQDWRYILYSTQTENIYYKFYFSGDALDISMCLESNEPEKVEIVEKIFNNFPSTLKLQKKFTPTQKILFFRIEDCNATGQAADLMASLIKYSYEQFTKDNNLLYNKEKRRMLFSSESKILNLEDLQHSNAFGRMTIKYNNIEFESCIVPKKSKNLYFFLTAGYRVLPDKSNYPAFNRSSWADFMDGTCVYLDDAGKKLKGGSYFYDKSIFLLKEMVTIIKKFMTIFDVSAKNVFFIGSSMGGYAAMYLASEIPFSTCLAYSPIFSLPVYHEPYESKKIFEKNYQISLNDKKADIFNRFDLTERIFSNNTTNFFITFNRKSKIDLAQIEHIAKYHDIDYKKSYNINHTDNIYIYIYDINCLNPHVNAQPDELFTQCICENLKHQNSISEQLLYTHYITWTRYLTLQKNHKLCNDQLQIIKDAVKKLP